jgi:hypothetical protein
MNPAIPKKTMKTFQEIETIAWDMYIFAGHAEKEASEKKRDKIIEKIMKLNEKIEKLYSCNWH